MKAYLVMARCGQDDIPLYVFFDYEKAKRYAENVSPVDAIEIADVIFNNDISDVINVGVATFIDGEIQKWEIVKAFDE